MQNLCFLTFFFIQHPRLLFSTGIKAQPLDSSIYHWQASITGPVGSPYEGGIFYLYLKIPFYYPFSPPKVRFLTKIFHPNVSMHGDIGIDNLHHNWVSGKFLFSNSRYCERLLYHINLWLLLRIDHSEGAAVNPIPVDGSFLRCLHGAGDREVVPGRPEAVRRRRPNLDLEVCHARLHAAQCQRMNYSSFYPESAGNMSVV